MPFPLPYSLIFLRHGETDWNAEGRMQGQRDIPLNGRGRDQASSVGRSVLKWLGPDAASRLAEYDFQASPLKRTRDTMELARVAMGLPPQPYSMDDRLKELTFGRWEGLTWREVQRREPEAARERMADKWSYVPPGGESYAMLIERLRPWLETVSSDTLVVSHGGVARGLMYLLADVPADVAPMADIWQGRAIIFRAGGFRWV